MLSLILANCILNLSIAAKADEAFSLAPAPTPVSEWGTDTRIKIIGGGLQDKETKNVIALGCVGNPIPGTLEPSCRTLRHIRFSLTKALPEYIGEPQTLNFDHEPTQKELKATVKAINKNYRLYKKEANHDRNGLGITIGALIGGLGFGAYFIASDLAGHDPSTGLFVLAWMGFLGVVFTTQEIVMRVPLLATRGIISNAMADQNGWNWSIKPKKISHQNFARVEKFIAHEY